MQDVPEPSSEFGKRLLAQYATSLPPDPARPVYTCLRQAFVGRTVELADLASAAPTTESRARVGEIYEELRELRDWLDVPMQPNQKRAFPHLLAEILQTFGWPLSDIEEIVKPIKKPPRGRLPSKRLIAVEALELRLADLRRWSYARLAQKFCDGSLHDVGQSRHDWKCRDSMKQLIKAALVVFRKYCSAHSLEVPSEVFRIT